MFNFKKYRVLIGLALFLSLYSGALYTFATTYVAPGSTLDPAGLPGAYTVGPVLSYGEAVTTGHDNEVLYVNGSGDLASDSSFYRNSDGTTAVFMSQNSGVDTTGLMIANDILGVPGTDGIMMRKADTGGVVGSAVIGIFDGTPLGAPSAYMGFLRADDDVTGEFFQQYFFAGAGGLSAGDATDSGLLQLSVGGAALGADNQDGGGDDTVSIEADLDGGAGAQTLRGRYQDGTNDYGWQLASDGITFDFDNFSGASGTFYTFPLADGMNSQVLTTNGAGIVSWTSIAGSSGFTEDGSDNMFAGTNSGGGLSTGAGNLFIGVDAGQATDGDQNTIIGQDAGYSNSTGDQNTFIGNSAGFNNGTGYSNTFVGSGVGYSNTDGYYNTFIGEAAGNQNTTGNQNVFLGRGTGQLNTTGTNNTFLGYWSGHDVTTGNNNISIGMNSAQNLTTGSDNIIIGNGTSASFSTSGSIVIGNSLAASIDKAILIGHLFEGSDDPAGVNGIYAFLGDRYNLANSTVLWVDDKNQEISFYFGADSYTFPSGDGTSGQVLTTDGSGSLTWETPGGGGGFTIDGSNNMFAGTNSGVSLGATQANLFVGINSGTSVTTGGYNTFMGINSGYDTTTGNFNVFLGSEAGRSNDNGSLNVFIGHESGYYQESISNQVAIGYRTLYGSSNTVDNTGGQNTAIGYRAGEVNTSGSDNVFLGYTAGAANTTGVYNAFIGSGAGYSNTDGNSSIFIGFNAGYNHTTGNNNIFVGNAAGGSTVSGTDNVFIGSGSGGFNTGTGNIFMGRDAGYNQQVVDNQIAIGYMALRGSGTPGDNIGIGNIAIGFQASYSNVDGSSNNSFGYQAGYNNTSGSSNTFLGYQAGFLNTTGSQNFFAGHQAGYNNLSGTDNLFIGSSAGHLTSSGSGNIFFGTSAGNTNATGGNNVIIGYDADVATDSTSGAIALGNGAVAATNEFALTDSITNWKFQGDSYTLPTAFPVASGYVLVSSDAGVMTWEDPSLIGSDRTLKTDISPISYGLETVRALSPVSYNLIATGRPQVGFIAQEVEAIVPELVGTIAGDKKGIQYGQLSAVIVKAIQELDMKVSDMSQLSLGGTSIADQFVEVVLHVKSIVFGSSENPTGFTMYDTVTHEPYCVTLANGDFVKTLGVCGESNGSGSSTTSTDSPSTGETTVPEENSTEETVVTTDTTENEGESLPDTQTDPTPPESDPIPVE